MEYIFNRFLTDNFILNMFITEYVLNMEDSYGMDVDEYIAFKVRNHESDSILEDGIDWDELNDEELAEWIDYNIKWREIVYNIKQLIQTL